MILDSILKIIAGFAALAGFSALIAALVAIARGMGWIGSDEQAGKVTAALNLVAFAVLVGFGVFRPDLDLDFLDSVAAKLAAIALFVLGLVTQLGIPAKIFGLFYQARVPVLGVMGDRAAPPPVYPNYSTPELKKKE